jgi:hypothetical protein
LVIPLFTNELKYENKSDKGTNLDAPTWENYFKKLNTLSTEKAVLNEKFESLFETDRSKDLMNELDLPISAKEVTEATKKLKNGKSSGSDSILNYLTLSCHQVFTLRKGSRDSYFLLNMWSDVRHPALKPICSLRISSFLRIYFSSLAFKILLNSIDKQLVIAISL